MRILKELMLGQHEKEKYLNEKLLDRKIDLIESELLAHLMIDNNVGVTPVQNYEIKKIDSDCFNEE